jgi:NTP pyrophosphatase (non-canonical NTP hydrolase)
MDMSMYQLLANKTDQHPELTGENGLAIPFLGLAGEVGELLTEYKKRLRDGAKHTLFIEKVKEELGDILWYIANTSSKLGIRLQDVAEANIKKTHDRWANVSEVSGGWKPFDEIFPESEQFPRKFIAKMEESMDHGTPKVALTVDGKQLGSQIDDNSYVDDGYRYHDAFHLAHLAVMHWSPVIRAFMRRKRKSIPEVDVVEDGARAIFTEEAVTAFIYGNAINSNYFQGVAPDFELLKTVRVLVAPYEVRVRTTGDWERAIQEGYAAFLRLRRNRGGLIEVDMVARSLKVIE